MISKIPKSLDRRPILPMPTHTLVCSHCGETIPIFNIRDIPVHCRKEKFEQGRKTQAEWMEAWIIGDGDTIEGMDHINTETTDLYDYLVPTIIEEFTPVISQGEVH